MSIASKAVTGIPRLNIRALIEPATDGSRSIRYPDARRASRGLFLCICTLLFATSAILTSIACSSMSSMGEMPMPGGWSMSMMWMPMPRQTWPG